MSIIAKAFSFVKNVIKDVQNQNITAFGTKT